MYILSFGTLWAKSPDESKSYFFFFTYHKKAYIILTPLIPLGFTGYTLFSLFLLKNINCGYSLEPPHRGGSNEFPQCFEQKYEKYSNFLSENFKFFGDNF